MAAIPSPAKLMAPASTLAEPLRIAVGQRPLWAQCSHSLRLEPKSAMAIFGGVRFLGPDASKGSLTDYGSLGWGTLSRRLLRIAG